MLLRLNKNAASRTSGYIPWGELKPGRYKIKKFSLCEPMYGKTEDQLCIHIQKGYLILPERMCDKLNNPTAVADLNANSYDLLFEGKDQSLGGRLLFSFAMHHDASSTERKESSSVSESVSEKVANEAVSSPSSDNDNDNIE